MNLSGILFYVMRAARFSLAACLVYAACRAAFLAVKRRPVHWKRELMNLLAAGYLAALAEIIALRGGMGNTRQLRLIPFYTTVQTFREGLWAFVYNLAGNVIWFVPLGMLLHRKKPVWAMCIGAAASVSLEIMQWILMTGVTDADDVIINALGTLLGVFLMRILNKFRKKSVQYDR